MLTIHGSLDETNRTVPNAAGSAMKRASAAGADHPRQIARFHVQQLVGSGAFGQVFRALRNQTGLGLHQHDGRDHWSVGNGGTLSSQTPAM